MCRDFHPGLQIKFAPWKNLRTLKTVLCVLESPCDSLTDVPRPQTLPFPCRLLARTCVRHRPIPATCYLTTRARPTLRTSPAERRGEGEPSQEKRKRKKKTHAPYNQSRPLNEELHPPTSPFPFSSPPPPYARGADVESRLAEALFLSTRKTEWSRRVKQDLNPLGPTTP